MDRLFEQNNGELHWGLGQTIAFIGSAVRPPEIGFSKFHGGDPSYDEPLKTNPSWDALMPRGRKLLGSTSFLKPPTSQDERWRQESLGVHEYAVAWLAVQDAGFVHKFCKGMYEKQFGCNGTQLASINGDAHDDVRRYFAKHSSQAEDQICSNHVRRPASLAFNAQAYFLQVYAGSSGRRALRKDDHYIELELGNAAFYGEARATHDMMALSKTIAINRSSDVQAPPGSKVPSAFIDRLRRSLEWLLNHHAKYNITVACVSVLTMQRFDVDPVKDEALETAAMRLQQAGVLVLANGGNCRHFHRNCTGLPWPAVARGFTPVGSATTHNPNFNSLNANKFTSDDVMDCNVHIPAVCGAHVTSSALPYFAAAALLIRETILRTGFVWQAEGATIPEAILHILHKTGMVLKRNPKATRCSKNRRCINVARALAYIRGNASERSWTTQTAIAEYPERRARTQRAQLALPQARQNSQRRSS